MLHYLWVAIVGLFVGAVAKFFMPGQDGGGWVVTSLLGIGGSFVANYLGQALGWYKTGSSAGFIASVVGAMLLLLALRILKGL